MKVTSAEMEIADIYSLSVCAVVIDWLDRAQICSQGPSCWKKTALKRTVVEDYEYEYLCRFWQRQLGN